MKKAYIESVVHEIYCAEMETATREMLKEDCTEEFANAVQEVYITKVKALELLHLQLGHLPYQRIERMLQCSNRYQLRQEAATSTGKAEERYMYQSQGD